MRGGLERDAPTPGASAGTVRPSGERSSRITFGTTRIWWMPIPGIWSGSSSATGNVWSTVIACFEYWKPTTKGKKRHEHFTARSADPPPGTPHALGNCGLKPRMLSTNATATKGSIITMNNENLRQIQRQVIGHVRGALSGVEALRNGIDKI